MRGGNPKDEGWVVQVKGIGEWIFRGWMGGEMNASAFARGIWRRIFIGCGVGDEIRGFARI
jgi:hypothetical protein